MPLRPIEVRKRPRLPRRGRSLFWDQGNRSSGTETLFFWLLQGYGQRRRLFEGSIFASDRHSRVLDPPAHGYWRGGVFGDGGDGVAGESEDRMGQQPIMRLHEGGGDACDENSGEALMNDVFDLIRRRLPSLPLEDPTRPALAALCPMLAQALGRPQVVEVRAALPLSEAARR